MQRSGKAEESLNLLEDLQASANAFHVAGSQPAACFAETSFRATEEHDFRSSLACWVVKDTVSSPAWVMSWETAVST